MQPHAHVMIQKSREILPYILAEIEDGRDLRSNQVIISEVVRGILFEMVDYGSGTG